MNEERVKKKILRIRTEKNCGNGDKYDKASHIY